MPGTCKIPLFGIARQYQNLKKELLEVSDQVYSSGQVLDGDQVDQFERNVRSRTNRKYAIAVNSCTQALIFSLKYYQSRRYTPARAARVLIPSVSFVATINAVIEAGCIPVFSDIHHNGLMDLTGVDLNQVDIVMYVNLCGDVIDYDRLTVMNKFFNRNIPVIEDAAQSFGALYKGIPSGKLGDISCLSFDPTKNLNNYGSGGMILTDDQDIAYAMRDYRDNGKADAHNISGTNSKMSEVDCAQMLVKLQYFDKWQERRREIAAYYDRYIIGQQSAVNSDVVHARSKYIVNCCDNPQTVDDHPQSVMDVMDRLTGLEIPCRPPYSSPLLGLEVSRIFPASYVEIPSSYHFCQTTFMIPIYPELTDSEVEYIVKGVNTSVKAVNDLR